MTNKMTLRAVSVVAFAFASHALAEAPALTSFRSCLAGTATTCVLQPLGTYTLDAGLGEIVVTNPNLLTIRGASVTPTETVLKRPNGATGMVHIMNIQKANVTIQDLTFDGNKDGNPGLPSGWADLLLNADNISVIDVYFDQAVHFALQLGTNSRVTYCTFKNSRDAGIWGAPAYTSFTISGNSFHDIKPTISR